MDLMDLKLHHKKKKLSRTRKKVSRRLFIGYPGAYADKTPYVNFLRKQLYFLYILQQAHGNVNECNYISARLWYQTKGF